ncbi:MAG TPA: 2-oxo-4-hydroxy-4-carboxy-5-ureidoimidazoline decarboxylase [Candidatus Limnocylindria bacterium]|nr:2-oxo-4-hydroxy-4-carboxy-5-ureidoimidazoline decarboxylase [Candidatus Limnocylindria bacterium]
MTVAELNALPEKAAAAALDRCCGAEAWIEGMLASRPYRDRAHLLQCAGETWHGLRRSAQLGAFAHHPRIGDHEAMRRRFAGASDWAAGEQRGAAEASPALLDRLAEGNRSYEEKFGYIFIVRAAGRSAEDMLALLETRLGNDPEREWSVASEEHAGITRLRLEKLLSEDP